MGLIKAFTSAVSSELADQYLEYFYCDSLSSDVLLTKGSKKNTKHSSNHASDNVISNGSGIVVNDGQCALIVSQGAIAEVCAEAGVYTYNASTESSIFAGGLGKGILESFKQFGKRFAHGGEIPTDQRVYYINTKEIMDNKFGTSNPLPFRVIDQRTGIDFDLSIRCHGTYTFRIQDPILFYRNVSGNITGNYNKSHISNQLREELLNGMIPVFTAVGAKGVRYSEIGLHSEEVRRKVMESLDTTWRMNRGIFLVTLSFNSIDIPPEDLERIKDIQQTAVYTNSSMLGAKLGLAQAEALKSAAANESTGSMMAFAGMNMATMAGANTGYGNMVNNGTGIPPVSPMSPNYAAQQESEAVSKVSTPDAAVSNENIWKCSCGADNSGKFCMECGQPKPAPVVSDGWECPSCKTTNKGKFCTECGSKKPASALLYKCDKCNWEPDDPAHPPKFCPECGDPFDENDIQN